MPSYKDDPRPVWEAIRAGALSERAAHVLKDLKALVAMQRAEIGDAILHLGLFPVDAMMLHHTTQIPRVALARAIKELEAHEYVDVLANGGLAATGNLVALARIQRNDRTSAARMRRHRDQSPHLDLGPESLLRDDVAAQIRAGRFTVNGEQAIAVATEVRIGNSYADVVATFACGTVVIEMKRRGAGNRDVWQLRSYLDLYEVKLGARPFGVLAAPYFLAGAEHSAADVNFVAFDRSMGLPLQLCQISGSLTLGYAQINSQPDVNLTSDQRQPNVAEQPSLSPLLPPALPRTPTHPPISPQPTLPTSSVASRNGVAKPPTQPSLLTDWVPAVRAAGEALFEREVCSLSPDERYVLARYHALEFANCTRTEATNKGRAVSIAGGIATLADRLSRHPVKRELTVAEYVAGCKRIRARTGGRPFYRPLDVDAEIVLEATS